MKPFKLECRIDAIYPDGMVCTGSWQKWKSYGTERGVLDALKAYNKAEIGFETMIAGKRREFHKWYWRPAHQYE